jgi:hypothetical protein
VFCPNCGTKNDDTATPCTKCGFKLSGASAPKFRGTMMLNTDQSVQEMVDEHRRKLTDGAATEEPAEGPSAPLPHESPAPASAAREADPVLPPRAGLPKRRMGTMLGVAPQVGGVQPSLTPTPPPPSPRPAPLENSPPSSPDPLGGTIAFGAVAPTAGGTQPLSAGRTEAFAAVPPAGVATPGHRPLGAGRTQAFGAVPPATPEPNANPLAAGRTETFSAVPDATAAAPPPPHPPRSSQAEPRPSKLRRQSTRTSRLPQRLRRHGGNATASPPLQGSPSACAPWTYFSSSSPAACTPWCSGHGSANRADAQVLKRKCTTSPSCTS